jgi:hypothetical protein
MKRPKLPHISEEMRRLCVALGAEMHRWPGVRTHPMFGLRAFYRGKIVFALIPDKRAFERADSIAYKIAAGPKERKGRKWKLFELTSDRELTAALDVLNNAYEKAASTKRARTKSARKMKK